MAVKFIIKVVICALCSTALFALFIFAENYKDNHRFGRIVNRPPYKTYQILQPLQEIKLKNDARSLFNGCIINHPHDANKFFLTYRITHNDFTLQRYSFAGLITLNQNLQDEQHRILDLISDFNLAHDSANQIIEPEDARIFWFKDKLHLLYHAEYHDKRTMFLATLRLNEDKYVINNIHNLTYTQNAKLPQKNWVPFTYRDDLYLIYSANPTEILRYNPNAKIAEAAYKVEYSKNILSKLWPYGDIRGGTPAQYIPELDAYLTFFHSCLPYKFGGEQLPPGNGPLWRIYYMGAYIFENKPPFKILAITKRPLTFGDQYKDTKTMYHIIFPCGFVQTDDRFIISSGLGDSRLVLFEIKKQDLYKRLTWLKDQKRIALW